MAFLPKRYECILILFIGLSERVQSILAVLKNGSGGNSNTTAMKRALRSLPNTPKENDDFVKELTDFSGFARFLNNSNHQKNFEALNIQLSHDAIDLNLVLNIISIFSHDQDVVDRQADLAEISGKLDEIALAMAKQQQEHAK